MGNSEQRTICIRSSPERARDRDSGSRGGPPSSRSRGMTLLELLLVLSIVSLLFGATAGILSGLDVAPKAAVGSVQSILRSARNAALAGGGGASVAIDIQNGSLHARTLDVAGSWHFETPALEGAFGIDGALFGAALADDGFLGHSLVFGPAGATAKVPIAGLARFDLTDGFALTFALRSEGSDGGDLVDVGGSLGVVLTSAQALRAWMAPWVVDVGGRGTRGARQIIETEAAAVDAGRWSLVRFAYDRQELVLEIDGVVVARSAEPLDAQVSAVDSALVLGDPRGTLAASIDALSLWATTASETYTLDPEVHFGPKTPRHIRFDARGHLERNLHREAAILDLQFADGSARPIRVGLYGIVE